MQRKMVELTEREKSILKVAKQVEIIVPYQSLVGIRENEWVLAYLLANTHEKKHIALEFYPTFNRKTKSKLESFSKQCKKYLDELIGEDLLLNHNDEERYYPASRTITREYPASWEVTTGLYSLSGQKIPNIITPKTIEKTLKGYSRKGNISQFDFSGKIVHLKSNQKPKLSYFSDGITWEVSE